MRKYKNDRLVFIITPLCHGNGGWCGQSVVGRMILSEALKFSRPEWEDESNSGGDARARICLTEDVNNSIYIYDADNQKWEPVSPPKPKVKYKFTKLKTPKLIPIDLSKCYHGKGSGMAESTEGGQSHPDIKVGKNYLAKIDGEFFAGKFSRVWYGLSFDGWGSGAGLQLDKPGTNSSDWQALWEIIK